jgi:two-component system CheB/CheR fusion protein
LQVVLQHLQLGQKIAYVVAQHVSPHHRSLMAELLDKETALVVTPAKHGQQLLPDHVYVTPPNADVTLDADRVQLSTPVHGHGARPSIDGLFLSLASEWGQSAVGVLLSGTGDDGTYGMREIRAMGGFTIAQDPQTAKYQAMPASAIRAGATDLVLAPERIGDAVVAATGSSFSEQEPVLPATFLQRVVEQLRISGAGDFGQYKSGTLLRQIARRMSVLQFSDEADYLTYLVANAMETRMLRQSLLVSVTSFYRDPSSWEALTAVLRERWQGSSPDRQVRIWVPGCATGEEAYTVGMMIDDVLGHPVDLSSRVKIFATDLDEVSLDYGRRGAYPSSAIASLPQQWQQRYFTSRSSQVEVAGWLRDMTVFARHNIATDPAFVRLDLVSFRNVMIYFENALQNRVLRALHYAMRPEAVLFLGASEGLAGMQDWFVPLSSKHRIFERIPGGSTPSLVVNDSPATLPQHVPQTPRADRASLTRDALVKVLLPSAVVVDENERVVEIFGDASEYLCLPDGRFDDRLVSLLREDLRVDVRGLVVQARASAHQASTILTRRGVSVSVRALPLVTAAGVFVTVTFDSAEIGTHEVDVDSESMQRLRTELAGTREALQATIEELETSNEELQATNEEMTASSEELQASNEELETINEELQATNEELGSLNQELQVRQHELSMANEDLRNIQDALSHALLIVDREMRVTRYSPLAVRVFALVESDIGRPLSTVPTTVNTDRLEGVVCEVIASGTRGMIEVAGDDHSYVVQVVPYRAADGAINGAILSISDRSSSASLSSDDAALVQLRAMAEGLDEVVWRREDDGRLSYVNHAVFDLFGVSPEQAMSDPHVLDLAIDAADLAAFRSLADPNRPHYLKYQVVAAGHRRLVEDFVHAVIDRADGSRLSIGSIRRVRSNPDPGAAGTESVIAALLSLPAELALLLDQDGVIVAAGQASMGILGANPAELTGRHLMGLVHEQDIGAVTRAVSDSLDMTVSAAQEPPPLRVRVVGRGGSQRWVSMVFKRLPDGSGARHVVLIADLSSEHERAVDLGRKVMFDAATGLLNRTSFIDALRVELVRQAPHGGRTAVLWLDLDGFKEINDQYGHSVGDLVLMEVAERLQTTCRRQDRVGRLGGDEFGVLITDCHHVDVVENTAARIIDVMTQAIDVPNGSVTVGVSIGASLAPHDAQAAEELLNAADAAMYLAKRGGGARFQYYKQGLNEEAARRATLRQLLAEAIRDRAFRVVYQPILSLADNQVWGLEALVRWQRGDELVSAGEFIPAAERTGQIRIIGRQVWETVFQDMPAITWLLPSARVCINLSVVELEDAALVAAFLKQAPQALLGNLAVEVTESALIGEDSQAVAAIEQMQRSGVSVSLDDFGTGYANFAALDRVAPQVIKADRSFLDRAVSGFSRARSLLNATVALSDAVGAFSLAEGVSSPEHEVVARETGVALAQGFHLGMPMSMDDLGLYLAARS